MDKIDPIRNLWYAGIKLAYHDIMDMQRVCHANLLSHNFFTAVGMIFAPDPLLQSIFENIDLPIKKIQKEIFRQSTQKQAILQIISKINDNENH